MKKTYVTPEIERVAFQYRDQVVASSIPTTSCTQNWTGLSDNLTSGCTHTTVVSDSGF